MNELVDPKTIEIEGRDKKVRKFVISTVPYLSGGRELCTMYVPTALPKVGEYKANEQLARMMFGFIDAVLPDGTRVRLSQPEFVHSHVPDFLTGIKLEAAMLEHNLGFSVAEKMSGFLDILTQAIGLSTSKILTALQEQSSPAAKPRSKNSKRSTASKT